MIGQRRQPIKDAGSLLMLLASVIGGGFACAIDSSVAQDPQAESKAESSEAGEVSALPPGHPAPGLPPGHPQVPNPPSGASALPKLPPTSGSGEMALNWNVPAGWTAETPSSSMRRAQYRVAGNSSTSVGGGGDAECVVYYFGPGQGGDARSNAERWADQFGQADGTSSREKLKTEEFDVDGIAVLWVEVKGIYSGGLANMGGPVESLDEYMLLGAIAQGPDANWFFKLTGPEETVESQRKEFRDLLESLQKES